MASTEPTSKQLADLSALADGSLDPTRREEVQSAISSSPELTALYERERRVVQALHAVRAGDRAPARLRARIEAQRPSAAVHTRRRISYGAALAAGFAVIALALALLIPAGTPGGPSVSEAAALALGGPNAPAPMPDPSAPAAKLHQAVQEVYFPNWSDKFGWRAVGQRVDHVGGRVAVTVYYQLRGHRLAYTIVSAPALKVPGASVTTLNGTEYRTLRLNGRTVVTWERKNHTCVLSGTGVPASGLHRLAAWDAGSQLNQT